MVDLIYTLQNKNENRLYVSAMLTKMIVNFLFSLFKNIKRTYYKILILFSLLDTCVFNGIALHSLLCY